MLALAEAFSETYGMFYPLVVTDAQAADRIHSIIQKKFWSGEIETSNLGKYLYGMIPDSDALKVKSFRYASPGALELVGWLSVLWAAARAARAWIATSSELLDLWKKADAFFAKKKSLRKAPRKNALDDEMTVDVEEARKLAFQVGNCIGFDNAAVERIIEISGNPITALKYLVAIANEARKLTELERSGLVKLPPIPDNAALILGPTTGRRARGVKVETIKNRSRHSKER